MTDTTPPAEQGTHFWFMSIQTPNALGFYMNHYQGARTPLPGQTRFDLFNSIRAEVNRMDPRAQGGIVLAFDIQPNKI